MMTPRLLGRGVALEEHRLANVFFLTGSLPSKMWVNHRRYNTKEQAYIREAQICLRADSS